MLRRIACPLASLLGLAPWMVGAQAATTLHSGPVRIGRIGEGGPGDFTVFRATMRSLGYPDVRIKDWSARGDATRLPTLGAELVGLGVEQLTRFELVVIPKTARAIGLAIPNAVLLRADEVPE